MSGTEGFVFDLQRYSLHDGPGIRTVVFLKGCPLRCLWCSNPEGQKAGQQLEFFPVRCQKCGRCVKACPKRAVNSDLACPPADKIDRSLCDLCGLCVEACPNRAFLLSGKRMTVQEVMAEVKKDLAYYRRSGGGVTLSGGDSLAQPRFARSILDACRDANIHTAIETAGYAPEEVFRQAVEGADLVLFDLKQMDPEEHRRLTGVSNDRILSNLRLLVRRDRPVVVRVPLIPGFNDSEDNLRATGEFVASLGLRELHLMPFHQLGKDKYTRLGMEYCLGELQPLLPKGSEADSLAVAKRLLESFGIEVQVGG